MSKFPECFTETCHQTSSVYVEQEKSYLCGRCFDLGFVESEGERLVSPDAVATSLEIVEDVLKMYKDFAADKYEDKANETTEKLCDKLILGVKGLKDDLDKALDDGQFFEFSILKTEATNIQTTLANTKTFACFAIQQLWRSTLKEKKNIKSPASEARQSSGEEDKLQEELKQKELRIETLEEENKQLHQENEDLKGEKLKEEKKEENKDKMASNPNPAKKSALSEERTEDNRYKSSDISSLYKITTGKDEQFGPETWLTLKLNQPKHMEFLTSLNKRMPDIDRLSLRNIPLNCQEVNTFLATHFPNKVRELSFNYGFSLSSCLPFYLEELVEVSKRVTGELFIYEFEVSQDQLVALFSANKHKEYFGLPDCKLSLSSVPDFGGTLAGSTMQGLYLRGCGDSSYGDWGNNESHFENLIAGLSKEEDFRKNLKEIGMGSCGMEKNVVEKFLADHGFGHVEITSYWK